MWRNVGMICDMCDVSKVDVMIWKKKTWRDVKVMWRAIGVILRDMGVM